MTSTQDNINAASNQNNMAAIITHDDKNNIAHIESAEHDDVHKGEPLSENVDEFGAAAKSDPREIALVKKLDWYMMVSA